MTIKKLPPFDLKVGYEWMDGTELYAANFALGEYWREDLGGPTNKAGALTSTRNYEAYNFAGTQLFPVNDPVVSAVTGLEGWAAITPLLTHTGDLTNAAWIKGAAGSGSVAVVTPNAGIAPDGTNTAFRVDLALNGGTLAGDISWLYQNVAGAAGVTRTSQFFLRAFSSGDVGKSLRLVGAEGYAKTVTLTDAWVDAAQTVTPAGASTQTIGLRLRGNEALADSVSVLVWQPTYNSSAIALPRVPRPTAAAVTRLADNTTIPDWQAFVERYSLLDGLTVSGTLNIDRLSAANNRTIFQAGSANEFARLDFTTGNRVRMTLQTLGPELGGNGDFSNGTTGWSGLNATIANVSNTLQVTGTAANPGAVQALNGSGGKTYLIRFDVLSGTAKITFKPNIDGSGTPVSGGDSGTAFGVGSHSVALTPAAFVSFKIGDGTANCTIDNVSIREVKTLTLESGVVSATGIYDISARFKPGDYALTVSGGVAGDSDASVETLPDAIRTNPAYVGRDIAGSLHWNGNIPNLAIGKAA